MKKNALLYILSVAMLVSCSSPASSSKEQAKLIEKKIET